MSTSHPANIDLAAALAEAQEQYRARNPKSLAIHEEGRGAVADALDEARHRLELGRPPDEVGRGPRVSHGPTLGAMHDPGPATLR